MKVLLVCAAGMSTSILMKKMERYAADHGIEFAVEAVGVGAAAEACAGADCVLMGPQVRHMKAKVQEAVGTIPVEVIPPADYGSGNCAHVFALIDRLLAA